MGKNKEKVTGLAVWLEKFGVPKKWAIVIAILLVAGGVAATTLIGGCGVMDFAIKGDDGGSLTLKQDPETGKIIVVGQRPQVQGGK
ncbi:MAG: hypothetical protein RR553_09615, partial [Akkermansia sp.]